MMGLAEVLSDAEARGFRRNLAWNAGELRCSETGECVAEQDARIVDSIAVDMGTDPADDATIYLIESAGSPKGYMILADPFHADPEKAAFIDRLLARD
jgi:hypothetical protein